MWWRSWRIFLTLTGVSMDYLTPLEARRHSFQEFMEEWIIDQFVRTLEEHGLKKPWYWDEFMRGLDTWHHALHLGLWVWRRTLWWQPVAAVNRDERAWLAEKYPNWEKLYGDKWDVIIDNVNNGNVEATLPETLPWLCSTCHLPACNATQSRDGTWRVRDVSLMYDGRLQHFCTNACRQIYLKDRSNVNHDTLVDRFITGQIQPPDLDGVLGYMGLTPDVMGDDPDYHAWTTEYTGRPAAGIAATGPAVSTRQESHDRTEELIPLNAVFSSDFVHILVMVKPSYTMRDVAAEVARHVEGKRVRALPHDKFVTVHGERLADDLTVAGAGLRPRDHVVVDYEVPIP
jgi:toluene monooxygenase system protein A